MRGLLFLLLIFDNSFAFSETPLTTFQKGFNYADCPDIAEIQETKSSAARYFNDLVETSFSDVNDPYVSYVWESKKVVESLLTDISSYCNRPQFAENALTSMLKNFDQIQGMLVRIRDTSDDDSTTYYTIVMKDGTYTSIYFSN